jgi:membrane associated rhomboid family serine protease
MSKEVRFAIFIVAMIFITIIIAKAVSINWAGKFLVFMGGVFLFLFIRWNDNRAGYRFLVTGKNPIISLDSQ